MGSSSSHLQTEQFQNNYNKQPQLATPNSLLGTHNLMISHHTKQTLIHKQIIFQSSSECRQFICEFEKIQKKPFNIIYPRAIIKNGGLQTCSNIYQINVYFDLLPRNLIQIVKSQGLLNQSKAWFLLNQISKSLQILSESNRPHWSITPQNIYQNSYQNYFIYDSFFLIGYDPQSFLLNKLDNNELLSEKMKALLQKGMVISPTQGYEEDCYSLGFVLIFALTGIHSRQLQLQQSKRAQAVRNIMNDKRGILSSQLIDIIMMLTERDALKRMDNYQLRRILKDKEAEIIRNEEQQFEKSRKTETKTPRQLHQNKINLSRPLQQPHPLYPLQRSSQLNFQLTKSNQYPENRLVHQFSLQNNMRMTQPVPRIEDQYKRYSQQQSHVIHVEYPSDRSNALTRINSYDRLISKK